MSDRKKPIDPLKIGLQRHTVIVGSLAGISQEESTVIAISRMVDELAAAAMVDALERCTTEEARKEEIRKVREHYEPRWVPHEEVKIPKLKGGPMALIKAKGKKHRLGSDGCDACNAYRLAVGQQFMGKIFEIGRSGKYRTFSEAIPEIMKLSSGFAKRVGAQPV